MLSDENLLSASSAILQSPINIATFAQQKVEAVAGKSQALIDDNTNKIFYDNEKAYLKAYFDELKALNGTVKTEYSDTDLDNGGRLAPGNLHFPAPGWVKFAPKMLISNNGNPTSVLTDHEGYRLNLANGAIEFLLSGFNDGAQDEILVNDHILGGTIDTASAFVVGNRIVAIDGSNVVYGVVQSVTFMPAVTLPLPLPAYYAHTMDFTLDAPLTDAAMASNYNDGWTDLERKGITPPLDQDFLDAIEAQCDAEVAQVKIKLEAELAALEANFSTGDEAGEITGAKSLVNSLIEAIDDWTALPVTGITSRFSDDALNDLSDYFTSRADEIIDRVDEIMFALGSVSQDAEGAFTGTGHFLSLFKWIDLRINIAYGTLRNYYNYDLIIQFIDAKILGENNKKTEFEKIMVVKRITSEITGNDELTLDSVTDLNVADEIKIIDEDSPSMVFTILSITGSIVKLSSNVPTSYSVDKQARLIKEL